MPTNIIDKELEKFLERVKKGTNGCWNWLGFINSGGYGKFFLGKKNYQAHRYSYARYIGNIPKGMVIDHLCRKRSCVNPEHLEVVTLKENALRGIGPSAINSRKTKCIQGHPLKGDNLFIRKSKDNTIYRICRECRRRYNREWSRKHYSHELKPWFREDSPFNKGSRRELSWNRAKKIHTCCKSICCFRHKVACPKLLLQSKLSKE